MIDAFVPANARLADRGYDADWFTSPLTQRAITPCISSKANRKVPIHHDKTLYRQHHTIENMFGKLKDWRRNHTRYDRYAHTFFSPICIASIVVSLHSTKKIAPVKSGIKHRWRALVYGSRRDATNPFISVGGATTGRCTGSACRTGCKPQQPQLQRSRNTPGRWSKPQPDHARLKGCTAVLSNFARCLTFLTPEHGQCWLRLKAWVWFPAFSPCHEGSCCSVSYAALWQKFHLSRLSRFLGLPLLSEHDAYYGPPSSSIQKGRRRLGKITG